MSLEKPFFSLIIPTYNREKLVVNAINSGLAQTYKNIEIIVVDNDSADNTKEVVESIPDERVSFYRKVNKERGASRNYGVMQAKGQYVTFLDSDDIIYPNHFEEALKLIEKNPDCPVFNLAFEMKDIDTGEVMQKFNNKKGDIKDILMNGNTLGCIGVFIKTEIALKHKFSEIIPLSGTEDWLLWLQLAARYPFVYSNKITSCMLEHSQRSVHWFEEKQLAERSEIFLAELKKDDKIEGAYGKNAIRRLQAHMLTYAALHLSFNNKWSALKCFFRAIPLSLSEVFFKRRTLAIFKHLILS